MNEVPDEPTPDDVLSAVARYAPTPTAIASEWPVSRRHEALAAILEAEPVRPAVEDLLIVPISRRRSPARAGALRSRRLMWLPAIVAVVAVLAVAAALLLARLPAGRSTSSPGSEPPAGHGAAFDPPAGLPETSVGPGQYSYRIDQQIDLDTNGKPNPAGHNAMRNRNWVTPNGDIVSVRSGTQHGCFSFPHSGQPSMQAPTSAFFRTLPTDAGALTTYLRAHVQGSSSRDEAVFVAVGDALRAADGLATPRLRGALVAVLSRTPGVFVHEGERDYLGRPAVRADFVDQRVRPGEVQSLYFDPTTFQLLEERSGNNGAPRTYVGPSPAYDAAPLPADDPDGLTGAAYLDVLISEKVVDKLPTLPARCTR